MSLLPARPTESAAERMVRLERARNGMAWRIKRFSGPCLTAKEYEACCLSMRYDTDQDIAAQMRITPQRVSQLLHNAGLMLDWMYAHDVAFWWEQVQVGRRLEWRFICPHIVETLEYEAA